MSTYPIIVFAQDGTNGEDVADVVDSISSLTLSDWLWAAGLLVGTIIVAQIVRRILRSVIAERGGEFAARIVGRFASYIIIAFGVVYALNQLGVAIGPLLGILGVAGLALAFAFQDILENFLAGILMLIRRPFRPGDQISTGDYSGTVEDVNLRAVVLRTYDGVRVYVPNAMVWKNAIINYTELGTRRTTVEVGVAYDTDLSRAKEFLLDAVGGIDGVESSPAPEAWVYEFGASSINIAVRFWHQPKIAVEWAVRDAVAVAIKDRFDREGVEIPFPQRVLHVTTVPSELGG